MSKLKQISSVRVNSVEDKFIHLCEKLYGQYVEL